jgi:putative aldouronate transport system substrate-binding protein
MSKFVVYLMMVFLCWTGQVYGRGNTEKSAAAGPGGKLSLSMGMWGLPDSLRNDPIGTIVEDKLNIDVKVVVQDWSDYQQKIRLWAASDDLPDTFAGYPMVESWFPDFVKQGIIRSIPYAIVSKYPYLKRVFDNHYPAFNLEVQHRRTL